MRSSFGRESSVLSPSTGKPSGKAAARNIEQVVLGDVLFDTWYLSPYPDSLIVPANTESTATTNGELSNGVSKPPIPYSASLKSAICPRLHVCPYCFSYTPQVDRYIMHLRYHQNARRRDPSIPPVPESAEKIYEHDGYAVYAVDGEKEKLYCQNLSLFGKLFLEQKSVFFDTSGFIYHTLTYTPPPSTPNKLGRKSSTATPADDLGLRTQVLGFFSKEKMSWDSNNLACILIFPPFQHRQLGKLLMAISYKLSGWEWLGEEGCAIGGPEKPLSSMGRKAYLRFWAERIARYILSQSGDSDGKRLFEAGAASASGKKKKKASSTSKEELTIKEIGERTGMLAEDVIAALMEMDVCQLVEPKRKKHPKSTETTNGTGVGGEAASHHNGSEVDQQQQPPPPPPPPAAMTIRRSKVVEWAVQHGVDLEDPVKERGFIGEWATEGFSDRTDNDEDEEEDDTNMSDDAG